MRKAKNILMVVENLSVPSDPRVWREAQTLRQLGFRVCIISPKGETRDKSAYDCIDGIHIYRYHPAPAKHTSFGYMKEYLLALLKTFGLSLKIWYRHGCSVSSFKDAWRSATDCSGSANITPIARLTSLSPPTRLRGSLLSNVDDATLRRFLSSATGRI